MSADVSCARTCVFKDSCIVVLYSFHFYNFHNIKFMQWLHAYKAFTVYCKPCFTDNKTYNYVAIHHQTIEKRISVYSQVPAENGELIQVLRWVYFSCSFHFTISNKRLIGFNINTKMCCSTGMKKTSFTAPIMTISPTRCAFYSAFLLCSASLSSF